MTPSLLRRLTRSAADLTDLKAMVKAGARSAAYDFDADLKLIGDLQEGTSLDGLTARQQVLAEYFANDAADPAVLRSLTQEPDERDPIPVLINHLRTLKERTYAFDLDTALKSHKSHFSGPDNFGEESIGDAIRSATEPGTVPTMGTLGSEVRGNLAPSDVVSHLARQEADEAGEAMGEITTRTRPEDLFGEGASPANQGRLEQAIKGWDEFGANPTEEMISNSTVDHGPTMQDYARNHLGSDFAEAARRSDRSMPEVVSPELLDAVGRGDKSALESIAESVRHTQDTVAGKKPRKLRRWKTPQDTDAPEADRLQRGGTMAPESPPPPDGPPPTAPPGTPNSGPVMPGPPGPPRRSDFASDKSNLWELTKVAGRMLVDPDHALPKHVWKPMRSGMNKVWEWDRSWQTQMKRTFRGIKEGSREAEYIGIHMDVTPGRFTFVRGELAKRSGELEGLKQALEKQRATMPGATPAEIAESMEIRKLRDGIADKAKEVAEARHAVEWLQEGTRRKLRFEQEFGAQVADDLQGRASQLRMHYNTAGSVIAQSNLPGARRFLDAGGVPIPDYHHHMFGELPEWIDASTLHISGKGADGTVKAKFLMPRSGLGSGYTWDAISVSKAYFPTLGRKLYLEPLFKAFTPNVSKFRDVDKAQTAFRDIRKQRGWWKGDDINPLTNTLSADQRRYLGNWMAALQNQPTGFDDVFQAHLIGTRQRLNRMRNFEGKNRLVRLFSTPSGKAAGKVADRMENAEDYRAMRATSWLLDKINRGTLGGSIGFFTKNIAQSLNIIPEVGVPAWLVGARWLASKEGRQVARDMNVGREFTRFLRNDDGALASLQAFGGGGPMSDKRAYQLGAKMLNGVVYGPGNASEFINRGISVYAGAFHDMARRGHRSPAEAFAAGDWEKALNAGFDLSDKINFTYGVAGRSPTITQNPALVMGLQYTQYHHKMWQMHAQYLRRQQGVPLVHYALMSGYAVNLARRGAGVDISGWFGLPGLHPKNLATDDVAGMPFYQSVGLRALLSGFQLFSPTASSYDKHIAKQTMTEQLMIAAIPTYVQSKMVMNELGEMADAAYSKERWGTNKDWRLGNMVSGFPTVQATRNQAIRGEVRKTQSVRGLARNIASEKMSKIAIRLHNGGLDEDEQAQALRDLEGTALEAIGAGVDPKRLWASFEIAVEEVAREQRGGVQAWMERLWRQYPETMGRLKPPASQTGR